VRFKVDESVPVEAAALLRGAGHEADTVYDERLQGALDQRASEVCRAEGRALVTLDTDFADIRAYPPGEFAGILLLRPRLPAKRPTLALLTRVLPLLASEPLAGRLWIAEESRIRIRE
jgi:predicted nuclease of predicted toxin-antitoxin system